MVTKIKLLKLVAVFFLTLFLPSPADALDVQFVTASESVYGHPHDIVLSPDGSLLYVADNGRDRIAVLNPQSLKLLGVFGEDEVDQPHDVVFDAAGLLLVADTGNSRIAVYEVSGTGGRLVDSLRGQISRPEGVAVHPDGRVLATGAGSGNLVEFRDGKVIREMRGLSSPHDVEIDNAGRIWVADANNDRIVLVDESFRIARIYGGKVYGFHGPRYLDFDAAGRMYVADKYNHNIKVIAPDGRVLRIVGKRFSGKGANVFDRPEGVEIRGSDIWFSDTYNNRIVRYRMSEDS